MVGGTKAGKAPVHAYKKRFAQPLAQVCFVARLFEAVSPTKLPQLRHLEPAQLLLATRHGNRQVFSLGALRALRTIVSIL